MIRGFIVLLLLIVNIALLGWYIVMRTDLAVTTPRSVGPTFDRDTLQRTLNEIFRAHGVDDLHIRERTVPPGIRREVRVTIPRDLSMTRLNLEIQRASRAMGYTPMAREDMRTGNLSIHIRDNDAIVLTIIVNFQH